MKKSILIILAICMVMGAWAVNPNDHYSILQSSDKTLGITKPEDEENPYLLLIGEAEKAVEQEDYFTAAQRLKDALAVEPENPSNVLLLSNLGMMYSYLDLDSMALAAYDQAIEKAPAMVTVLANRGRLKLKMGRDRDAFKDFTDVLAKDSTNADALYYHGLMSLYGGNLPAAEKDFSTLERVDANSFNTWAALAAMYSLTQRNNEAIPYYKLMLEQDNAPEYYAALAGCYLAEGKYSEASAALAEGMAAWPSDPELYYYRAWLNRDTYRLDDAKADASKAVRLGADPRKVKALLENQR